MRKNMRRPWMAPRDYNSFPLTASWFLCCMRHDVAPQISENLGRHPTKSLKRLASPLAAARRTVQLESRPELHDQTRDRQLRFDGRRRYEPREPACAGH